MDLFKVDFGELRFNLGVLGLVIELLLSWLSVGLGSQGEAILVRDKGRKVAPHRGRRG